MPTREKLLKWGAGESVVGLPGNAPPGERTEIAAKTKEEINDEARKAAHDKMLAARAKGAAERVKEDKGDRVEFEIRSEKIKLVVKKSMRAADVILGFGRHKGHYLKSKSVPPDYIQWLRKEYLKGERAPVLKAVVDSILDRKPVELPAAYTPKEWAEESAMVVACPPAPSPPRPRIPIPGATILDIETKAGEMTIATSFIVPINSDAGGLLPAEEACGKLVHELNKRASKFGVHVEASFDPRDRRLTVQMKRTDGDAL